MNGASQCQKLRLDRLIERIKSVSKTFHQLEFFHILCEINDLVDQAGNKSMVLSKNEMPVNHLLSSVIPP